MKKRLLLIFMLFITFISNAQEADYTDFTQIANGLDNPNDLKIVDDILYVATESQILSYDVTLENPTATVVFNVTSGIVDQLNVVTFFNIKDGFLFVLVENIDTANDVFLESKVISVELSNTANVLVTETVDNYVSAGVFDGNLLYRITEDEDTDMSVLSVRDTSVIGSTATILTSFSGVVTSIDLFEDLVIISERNGNVYSVNINETTPVLNPLILGTTISNNKGIQVLNDGLFIAAGNKIYEGNLFDENVNLDIYPLLENITYADDNEAYSAFNDVVVYNGVAYMTVAENGLVVKSEEIASDYNCSGEGTEFTDFYSDLKNPQKIFVENNDLYVLESVFGISKIDINAKTKTTVYTALRDGSEYELPLDFVIINNNLYFTSYSVDVSSSDFDITNSSIKKIDLSNTPYVAETIIESTTETIEYLEINGDNIVYTTLDDTNEEPIVAFYNLELTNNTTANTGFSLDYYVEDFVTNGTDFYLINGDGDSFLKGDLTNITNPLTTFLDGFDYTYNLNLHNNRLYFSSANDEIQSVDLSATNPGSSIETIAVNGTVQAISEYGTTDCDSFYGIAFKENTIYTSMINSNQIVSFSNPTLTVKNIIKSDEFLFSINENIITFNEEVNSLTGNIYSVTGKKVKQFIIDDNKVSISNLLSGVYFIRLSNGNSYKFIK